MADVDTGIDTLASRLDQLEAANARLRGWLLGTTLLALAAFGGVLGVGGLWYRGRNKVPRELSVRSVTLNDANGKPRAWLGVNKDGPGISVSDSAGMTRLWLGVHEDRPSLSFSDAEGQTRLSFGLDEAPRSFAVAKGNEKAKLSFGVVGTAPYLNMVDKSGKPILVKP